jgi:hypothetical protein
VTSSEPTSWVAIADGDKVGDLLDTLALADDKHGLVRTSMAIDQDRDSFAEWFRRQGASVILAVADTVIAAGAGEPPLSSAFPSYNPTWSVGIGRDLSGAHAALAVAKATGRSRVVDGRDWEL